MNNEDEKNIRQMNEENLINAYECEGDYEMRHLIIGQLEKCNEEALNKWLKSDKQSPREFFNK